MEKKKEILNYTLILHQIRKKLKLSLLEYCIADSIYHLSNNPISKIPGWCFASKETISDFLGTTQRTVFSNINKLLGKNLIERDEKTSYLRTTQKWYEEVVLVKMSGEYGDKASDTMKKLHSRVGRNFTQKAEETSHNNNKYNKNYNNTVIKNFKDDERREVDPAGLKKYQLIKEKWLLRK